MTSDSCSLQHGTFLFYSFCSILVSITSIPELLIAAISRAISSIYVYMFLLLQVPWLALFICIKTNEFVVASNLRKCLPEGASC